MIVTHALLRSETVLPAIDVLHGKDETIAVEGLVELICRHRTANEAIAAIEALSALTNVLVRDALETALDSSHASVRLAAIQALHRRGWCPGDLVARVLIEDNSWTVRRAALYLLAAQGRDDKWRILVAAGDPHWRVRNALIGVLTRWGEVVSQRTEIDRHLADFGTHARVVGVRAFLQHRWGGPGAESARSLEIMQETPGWPLWDWDAAVLLRNLEELGEAGRRSCLDEMPMLLGHGDERVRSLASKCLRDWGEADQLTRVVAMLDDPRQDGFENALTVLAQIDDDRIEELTLELLHDPQSAAGQLAWALDQVGRLVPVEAVREMLIQIAESMTTRPNPVRRAFARLCARWQHSRVDAWLDPLLTDRCPDVCREALWAANERGTHVKRALLLSLLDSDHAGVREEAVSAAVRQGLVNELRERHVAGMELRVRLRLAREIAKLSDPCWRDIVAGLQADPHPHVRGAAMTAARAAELIREPTQETSWHVLGCAARMARIPLWNLDPPECWQPPPAEIAITEALEPAARETTTKRSLGPGNMEVAPLGISGHYGLPVQGFCRAYEAGVNLMFWEPNYRTMTEFYARIGAARRRSICVIVGSFEADGKRVRKDAERALRSLKIDQIGIFLLFWVQSWRRVRPDVYETLEELEAEGKIGTFGLSTHARPLAIEAIDTGWNPVMVRHSAAHRGAEREIFARAAQRGTGLITFSNTCYGRLLKSRTGPGGENLPGARAADCYRYSLMQPGVRACLSAPATLAQLEENLEALRDPVLSDDRRDHLLLLGERLYEEESMFRRLIHNVR